MRIFYVSVIVATLLCSLVAGFLFAFSVVVMPGIRSLNDKGFLQAFAVIDRVIQNNQPVFMLVWVGSVLALIISAIIGFGQLDAVGRFLMIGALVAYLLGVQLPTMVVNVPLNNQLQTLDIDALNDAELRTARDAFESRWNRWNVIRTVLSVLATGLLIVVVLRL